MYIFILKDYTLLITNDNGYNASKFSLLNKKFIYQDNSLALKWFPKPNIVNYLYKQDI